MLSKLDKEFSTKTKSVRWNRREKVGEGRKRKKGKKRRKEKKKRKEEKKRDEELVLVSFWFPNWKVLQTRSEVCLRSKR